MDEMKKLLILILLLLALSSCDSRTNDFIVKEITMVPDDENNIFCTYKLARIGSLYNYYFVDTCGKYAIHQHVKFDKK